MSAIPPQILQSATGTVCDRFGHFDCLLERGDSLFFKLLYYSKVVNHSQLIMSSFQQFFFQPGLILVSVNLPVFVRQLPSLYIACQLKLFPFNFLKAGAVNYSLIYFLTFSNVVTYQSQHSLFSCVWFEVRPLWVLVLKAQHSNLYSITGRIKDLKICRFSFITFPLYLKYVVIW